MKIVEVTWVDASCLQGWCSPDYIEANDGVPVVVSVGFLQKDTKDYINLTSHDSETGHSADIMSIPRGCIKKMKTLRRDLS